MKVKFRMNGCEFEMPLDKFTKFTRGLAESVINQNGNWDQFLKDSGFEIIYAGM